MTTPPRNLSVFVTLAGAVVAALAAGLQILIAHKLQASSGDLGDLMIFLTSLLSSLQTAGGLVLAVGLVGVVWSVTVERGLA